MKRFIAAMTLLCLACYVVAQTTPKQKELADQAGVIAKQLSLDKKTEHLTYNVLKHISERIEDLPLGHPNYKKLLLHINQERLDMMKVILSADKFKQYDKSFSPAEETKLKELNVKNDAYVKSNGTIKESDDVVDFLIEDKETKEDEKDSKTE